LLASLSRLRNIKPNKEYPTMTVMKFLHFFNPRLFPIWDREVVGGRVFRRFRSDYREFCKSKNLDPYAKGAKFIPNYTLWAGDLIRSSGTKFMNSFARWFRSQVGSHPDTLNVLQDIDKYYATAFEFVAIGAAS